MELMDLECRESRGGGELGFMAAGAELARWSDERER